MNFQRYRHGFSLIELLTVISIISLMSSIVLVAIQGVRERGYEVEVISEVRQIMNAAELFAADNNGNFPRENNPSYTSATNHWNRPDCSDNYSTSSASLPMDSPNGVSLGTIANWTNSAGNSFRDYFAGGEIPLDPWGQNYIVDAVYICDGVGDDVSGCLDRTNGSGIFAIHSPGPNGSGTNQYDSDNIIVMICDHAN